MDILSASNFTSFGFFMSDKNHSTPSYRYGFNGKEKDDEINSEGNSYDFGARMYDGRSGRWLAIDPSALNYPDVSPYNFVLNNPIPLVDPDGKDPREGNQVINVNFDKAYVIKIGDDAPKFTTYDSRLNKRASDYFAWNTAIGTRARFSGVVAPLYNFSQNVAKLEELGREKLSASDRGNQFVRASKSSTGYTYIEFNSQSTQFTLRQVSNLGTGYENVVTHKQVYESNPNATGQNNDALRVTQENWTSLYTKCVDGVEEKWFKSLTFTYTYDAAGNQTVTSSMKEEKAIADKR